MKIKTKSLGHQTPFLRAQQLNWRIGKSLLICLSFRMARAISKTWQLSASLPRLQTATYSSIQSITSTNTA
jgi:hypothetical protein